MLCYTHAQAESVEAVMDATAAKLALGFKAIRLQSGIPGLERVYGVGAAKDTEGDAEQQRPREGDWDTARYLRHAPKVFEAARERFGDDLHLLHDAHHRLTPNEAAQLGARWSPTGLFWLEDATPAENQEAWRRIRHHDHDAARRR